MGRSKFPGKPSKHVHKKRVNVLPCTIMPNKGITKEHNIANGISVANNIHTNENQVVAISEFSSPENPFETDTSLSKCSVIIGRKSKPEEKAQCRLQNKTESINDCSKVLNRSSGAIHSYSNISIKNNDLLIKSHIQAIKNTRRLVKKTPDKCLTVSLTESSVKGSDSNLIRKSICAITTRKRQSKPNRTKNTQIGTNGLGRQHNSESNNLVGKFVLPSKSLHSSRVIKPNKKFLNNEQIHNLNGLDCMKTCYKKPQNKSSETDKNPVSNKNEMIPSKANIEISNEAENVVKELTQVANDADSSTNMKFDGRKKCNDTVVIDSLKNSASSWSCGKLVLRKARLQLHTQKEEGNNGPFSSYTSSTVNPPGTVTCGVCGAVRFYRFVKQARKFNIYSCESCRKFISKMIKRQTCTKNCSVPSLVCHKGQGMCHVPPIVRSQQWKLIRCAYKARCPACWLKMCLHSFQMPASLKNNLANMLPENMRLSIPQNIEGLSSRKTDNVSKQLINWKPDVIDSSYEKTIIRDKNERIAEKIASNKIESLSKVDLNCSKQKKHRKSRLRLRKNNIIKANQMSLLIPECSKRQKLDLKGPRVKHVCRSASIVLGQPVATFSSEVFFEPTEKKKCTELIDPCNTCIVLTEEFNDESKNEVPANFKIPIPVEVELSKIKENSVIKPVKPIQCKSEKKIENDDEMCSKDTQNHRVSLDPLVMISTEFLGDCSPSEIYHSGFELIGTEPFPIRAVCFLCGSAGQEQMIHCASCCEPYHPFCLDNSIINLNFLHNNLDTIPNNNIFPVSNPYWRFTWTCTRCTPCYSCGNTAKEKTICQKCQKYFHSECMNPRWKLTNRPTICSSCLCCKICGSEDISKIMCKMMLCAPCFKLRKKGNFCPLCQRCCDENDFDTKMMECGECKFLIHAKCEGLSTEKYQILSYLPESVSFVCRTCSKNAPTLWEDIMKSELKNNYHNVLRSLSRNRLARKLLRWSQIDSETYSCLPFNNVKKIMISNVDKTLLKNKRNMSYARKTNRKNTENGNELLQCSGIGGPKNMQKDNESTENSPDELSDSNVKNVRNKLCLKECSVNIKKCIEPIDKIQKTNSNFPEPESINALSCSNHNETTVLSLLHIKNKINTNFYLNVKDFHQDLELVFKNSACEEINKVLSSILTDFFPWYDVTSSTNKPLNINSLVKPNHNVTCSAIKEHNLNPKKLKEMPQDLLNKYVYDDNTMLLDTRKCILCEVMGDGMSSMEGRLLYCGHNEWIHVNCAFWSAEVYEEIDGSLQNVQNTITRSQTMCCVVCKQKGASVDCCSKSCNQVYHFNCARRNNCFFMHDKTVFCPLHFDSTLNDIVVTEKEFEIRRPIYVESDKKRKKYAEPSKVQYLVGALTVINLGVFFPYLSDTEEAIITSDFVCTRLFWSTVEPWKIVRYKISTSVLLPNLLKIESKERNFTVDYSLSNELIENQLKEISHWKKEIECGKMEDKPPLFIADTEMSIVNHANDDKIVSQVVDYIIEFICSKEMEDNCDDEPQNTADLLPPELKDAIFEDLPHDLLDGISMQDIFPKLMSYEDVIVDLKNSDSNDSTDLLKDGKNELNNDINNLDSDDFLQFKCKKNDLFISENDFWLEPKCSIQDVEDSNIQNSKMLNDASELKRSKSEVFSGIKKLSRNHNHQRSCSLTWSCKLDNSLSSNIKKRKISCTTKNVTDISSNLFMVVDSSGEKASMLQELRLPEGVLMTVGRSTNAECVSDAVREFKYRIEENGIPNDKFKSNTQQIELGKENKCRVWPHRSQSRLLQVDGADDMSSSADEESYEGLPIKKHVSMVKKTNDEPVKCDRCQCTYRTHTSYKRHLQTCDFISTSESDSDASIENEYSSSVVTYEVDQNHDRFNISIETPNVTFDSQEKIDGPSIVSQTNEVFSSQPSVQSEDNVNYQIITEIPVDINTVQNNSIQNVQNKIMNSNIGDDNKILGAKIATFEGPEHSKNEILNENITPSIVYQNVPQTCTEKFQIEQLPSISINTTNTNINTGINTSNTNVNTGINTCNTSVNTGINTSNTSVNTGINTSNTSVNTGINTSNTSVNTGINTSNTSVNTGINTNNTSVNTGINTSNTNVNIGINNNNTSVNTGINTSNTSVNTGIFTNNTSVNTGINVSNTSMNTGINTSNTNINTNNTSVNTSNTSINTSNTSVNTSNTSVNTSNISIMPEVNNINTNRVTYSVVNPVNKNVPHHKTAMLIPQTKERQKTALLKKNITSRGRGRPSRSGPVKKICSDIPIQLMNQATHSQNEILQMSNNYPNNNPTIIIQHMPSPGLMPAYIDAFQQQTGQNLQCIATLLPNEYKTNHYVTPNQLVPGMYQLQSSESTNIVTLPNGTLSLIPNLQIQQPQQTVMGTLIQQPRPGATIQCGMMTTEQLLFANGVPTVETIVDTGGSMFLTAQPVYYGFETIVQNTVMQSQQFLSTTTVPGMLSNSSYSATTTQVFQASKIEPVVEMNSSGYIIVNPATMQQPIASNSQSVINIMQNKSNVFPQQTLPEPQTIIPIQTAPLNEPVQPVNTPIKYFEPTPAQSTTYIQSQSLPEPVPLEQIIEPPQYTPCNKYLTQNSNAVQTSSINLPIAPYPTDNNIPMNIVNPIPQVNLNSTSSNISRPMNRVLPMQTVSQRDCQKEKTPVSKVLSLEPPGILNRLSETVDKIQETLSNDANSMTSSKSSTSDSQLLKLESASLKLVFQKQSQDGIYKISNKYISKSNVPLQISPPKPTKTKTVENIKLVEEKKEKTIKPQVKQQESQQSVENNPHILYKIHSQDGYDRSSSSLTDLWEKVFEAVQKARVAHNMPPLPEHAFDMINGLQIIGLKSNGLRYMMEQLPGAARCMKYKPGFHKDKIENQNDNLVESTKGAVRCIPIHFHAQPYDMFSWLASRHRKPDYGIQVESDVTTRRTSSINLPVAMRYRQLKDTFKQAVGVYPSNIHGRGLFCLRDIDSGEMVIEYAGEVIRSTLTDKREKYYNSKGIGCYMFRIDDNLVIDATMKGNAARFINHSCDPNCYSRVLDILGHKHIIIFALRKIIQGEELTYDYKFPFEEDKIPCTCGSKKCLDDVIENVISVGCDDEPNI